jgi:DhnA family fructose-bisphosphate aldolase class Ia
MIETIAIGGNMSGIDLRMAKLFRGKKSLVISALDHVMEYGDQPGIEDSATAIRNCMGIDALLMSRFMLLRNPDLMGGEQAPLPIVRINWSSSFYYPLDYSTGNTCIATSVEDAVQAGAHAVICSLFLEEEGNEKLETDNVAVFSEVVRQKQRLGIPLIGECYVVEHKKLSADKLHAKVKRVTRVMAELGADLIKCFFTGDRFHEVVENLPVPVFTIGAEKLASDIAVLEKAKNSVTQGARGIIFGRNIFMAKKPQALIKALGEVMNAGRDPRDAAKEHGLS